MEIHHFEEVGSTQTEARRLASDGARIPLLVVARRQTRGRGREGREWVTAPRALACSLLVRPAWRPRDWGPISLAAGLAARTALRDAFDVSPGLKWPNDLVTDAGKVGGILVEAAGDEVTIGFGVNLWWPEPPVGMAGLVDTDAGWEGADEAAEAWARRILRVLEGPADHWGRDEYRAVCETLGSTIEWEPEGSGRAVDVAADGGLVVESGHGRVTLRSGAVRTVRPTTIPPEPSGEEH